MTETWIDLTLLWIAKWFVICMAVLIVANALCDWIDKKQAQAKFEKSNAWRKKVICGRR